MTSNNIQYDAIIATNLPANTQAFAAYLSGDPHDYNDFASCVARFPHAKRKSITTEPEWNANILDIENGAATIQEAASWLKSHSNAQGFYIQAASAQALINDLYAAGIGRSTYKLCNAHWIGEHICEPAGCGYPYAECTQWAGNINNAYDISSYRPAWYPSTITTNKGKKMHTHMFLFNDPASKGKPASQTFGIPYGSIWLCTVETGTRVYVPSNMIQYYTKNLGLAIETVSAMTIATYKNLGLDIS